MWAAGCRKGLPYTAFLQQGCERTGSVLRTPVAVKGQVFGLSAILMGFSKRAGDKVCAGIAGYAETNHSTGAQV